MKIAVRYADLDLGQAATKAGSWHGKEGAAPGVEPGSAIAGIMSDARADAIYEYHAASDTEFNEAA
ncbi:hypothetical protein ABZT28_54940, partial [Streptomyces sp. NPDC005388]|uniref:hypothetical protein n=1 Tax=Streptomyces sp. NPDC005388 TaxID=3156717 RepID=UPI0033B4A75D